MDTFVINGGKKLKGEIIPQGAKNEALQVICAVLLTPEEVTISNIPNIVDVNKLIDLLKDLGVKIKQLSEDSYTFQADDINLEFLNSQAFKDKGSKLRGSI
ncbi:MAG: UDP-N-acetylglucosamine 1-carboxyvinyltransferase, partial [Saprospiraceae bacterium]